MADTPYRCRPFPAPLYSRNTGGNRASHFPNATSIHSQDADRIYYGYRDLFESLSNILCYQFVQ